MSLNRDDNNNNNNNLNKQLVIIIEEIKHKRSNISTEFY